MTWKPAPMTARAIRLPLPIPPRRRAASPEVYHVRKSPHVSSPLRCLLHGGCCSEDATTPSHPLARLVRREGGLRLTYASSANTTFSVSLVPAVGRRESRYIVASPPCDWPMMQDGQPTARQRIASKPLYRVPALVEPPRLALHALHAFEPLAVRLVDWAPPVDCADRPGRRVLRRESVVSPEAARVACHAVSHQTSIPNSSRRSSKPSIVFPTMYLP